MSLEKKNILITEFMGHTFMRETFFSDLMDCELELMDESDLYFHTSWDWLMPVIHKCENLRLSSPGSEVYYDILMHEIHNRLMQANILDTFEEVVRFIQWHNQNKAE